MNDPLKPLATAMARFMAVDIPVSVAKVGILGFWVVSRDPAIRRAVEGPGTSYLDRARESRSLWVVVHDQAPNPYEPIVDFLEAGGQFGRWENSVLDVWLPDGERFGVPLTTIERAAQT